MRETMDRKTVARKMVCQGLTLGITVLKLFFPHELLYLGEEVTVDLLANLMDPKLIPWIFVLNIYGYWMKKLRLPKWMPPLPVQIFALSFIVCSLFGWAHTGAEGVKAVIIATMDYGIVNGILVAFSATFGYDVYKGFVSRKKEVKA